MVVSQGLYACDKHVQIQPLLSFTTISQPCLHRGNGIIVVVDILNVVGNRVPFSYLNVSIAFTDDLHQFKWFIRLLFQSETVAQFLIGSTATLLQESYTVYEALFSIWVVPRTSLLHRHNSAQVCNFNVYTYVYEHYSCYSAYLQLTYCQKSDSLRMLNSTRKQQINFSTQQHEQLTAWHRTTPELIHNQTKNQL